MPLFLITSVDDEGVYQGRFRVVKAESAETIAQAVLDNPWHWDDFFRNTELWWNLTYYEYKYGVPLDWTAEEMLKQINKTYVDGDSRNQVRIHEIEEMRSFRFVLSAPRGRNQVRIHEIEEIEQIDVKHC